MRTIINDRVEDDRVKQFSIFKLFFKETITSISKTTSKLCLINTGGVQHILL